MKSLGKSALSGRRLSEHIPPPPPFPQEEALLVRTGIEQGEVTFKKEQQVVSEKIAGLRLIVRYWFVPRAAFCGHYRVEPEALDLAVTNFPGCAS